MSNIFNSFKKIGKVISSIEFKQNPNKSKFKRNDYLILGALQRFCFLLWIRQNDQKYMQPVRDQRIRLVQEGREMDSSTNSKELT